MLYFVSFGIDRLDVNHKGKAVLSSKKLSFASREEAEVITEQTYGGISPLRAAREYKNLC